MFPHCLSVFWEEDRVIMNNPRSVAATLSFTPGKSRVRGNSQVTSESICRLQGRNDHRCSGRYNQLEAWTHPPRNSLHCPHVGQTITARRVSR